MRNFFLVSFMIVFVSSVSSATIAQQGRDYTELRRKMVNEQIIARGITDRLVINAMLKVPRHEFVPENLTALAYIDSPLPIGEGQTISQPYIVALMTQLLVLKGNEKVLEIGTGSGYQAAILAEIAREVYTIEILKPLADSAEKRLIKMGYKNIKVLCADGYLGLPRYAPFDAIIVTAAADKIPQPLMEQLKPGGRMVIPLGDIEQQLVVITKTEDKIVKKNVIPVRFVPMTGKIENE